MPDYDRRGGVCEIINEAMKNTENKKSFQQREVRGEEKESGCWGRRGRDQHKQLLVSA